MKKLLYLWKRYSFFILALFIILGLFDSRIALGAIFCMVMPIIISFFKGRFWCGNLCPRGSFFDNVVVKFSNKKKIPKFFKSYYFRIIVIAVMMSAFTIGIKNNLGNPYGIGMVFYRMIVATTLIGTVLALFFNQRTWCSFCPMGTIASLVSRLKRNKSKLLFVNDSCVNCKKCEKECPMGMVPYEYKGDFLSHPDCIQCGKCKISCPKNAINYNRNI